MTSPQESKRSKETETDDLYTVNIIYCNIYYNYVTCNCTRTTTLQLDVTINDMSVKYKKPRSLIKVVHITTMWQFWNDTEAIIISSDGS